MISCGNGNISRHPPELELGAVAMAMISHVLAQEGISQ
jgi:hypothetical protein